MLSLPGNEQVAYHSLRESLGPAYYFAFHLPDAERCISFLKKESLLSSERDKLPV